MSRRTAVQTTRPLPVRREQPPVLLFALNPLRTARLVLRPLRESDRDEFIRVVSLTRSDLSAAAGSLRPGESDEAYFERQLELCRRGDDTASAWRRIGELDDGRIAGAFNLNSITRGLSFEAEANWWISADCRGIGLAVEGVSAMLDYALADLPAGLGLHTVFAAITPSNAASVAVAKRCEFTLQKPSVQVRLAEGWTSHDLWARRVSVS
ncbi:MAG: GNAT family N-acetyltransferase [Planctomycetes bacterium]|nr:GNAT family N-acetyltransferase [Planctomycetota bacterium]